MVVTKREVTKMCRHITAWIPIDTYIVPVYCTGTLFNKPVSGQGFEIK
jgi:hypothetical protein